MTTLLKISYSIRIFLVISLCAPVKAGSDWELKIDIGGVKIYQQQRVGFKQLHTKGSVVVVAQAQEVLALMEDLSLCSEWLYGCISAKQHGDGLTQMFLKGPMWYKDRDVVFSTKSHQLEGSGQWHLSMQNQPNMHIDSDHIRVKHTDATWLITQLSPTQVTINYELYIDPEIKLRSGVDKYNRDAMFRTLRNIRKLLKSKK